MMLICLKGAPVALVELETKRFGAFEIKDEARGEVEAEIATIGIVDKHGDVFLAESTPPGAKVKVSSYSHDIVLGGAAPVGVARIEEDGDKIMLRGRFFVSTERGREAFLTVKELGEDGEWSIGFPNSTVKTAKLTDEWKAKGAKRLIAYYEPMEASPVFRGAQPGTRTVSVKTSIRADESLTDRVEAVHNALWARNDALPPDSDDRWWAHEIFEDHVIVRGGSKMFRVAYTMDGEGKVELGESVEVEIVYRPVEQPPAPATTAADDTDPDAALKTEQLAAAVAAEAARFERTRRKFPVT